MAKSRVSASNEARGPKLTTNRPVTQLTDLSDVNTKTGTGTQVVMSGMPILFAPILWTYSDATRPAPVNPGMLIFNTDDGQLNIATGTDWTLPDGTVT